MDTKTGEIKTIVALTREEVMSGKWEGISDEAAKSLGALNVGERLDWWERQKAANPAAVADQVAAVNKKAAEAKAATESTTPAPTTPVDVGPYVPPAISVGRTVHIVMSDGEPRPMIVTAVFAEHVNGTVFLDGSNDSKNVPEEITVEDPSFTLGRAFSISQDEERKVGTWHWPPRA